MWATKHQCCSSVSCLQRFLLQWVRGQRHGSILFLMVQSINWAILEGKKTTSWHSGHYSPWWQSQCTKSITLLAILKTMQSIYFNLPFCPVFSFQSRHSYRSFSFSFVLFMVLCLPMFVSADSQPFVKSAFTVQMTDSALCNSSCGLLQCSPNSNFFPAYYIFK